MMLSLSFLNNMQFNAKTKFLQIIQTFSYFHFILLIQ